VEYSRCRGVRSPRRHFEVFFHRVLDLAAVHDLVVFDHASQPFRSLCSSCPQRWLVRCTSNQNRCRSPFPFRVLSCRSSFFDSSRHRPPLACAPLRPSQHRCLSVAVLDPNVKIASEASALCGYLRALRNRIRSLRLNITGQGTRRAARARRHHHDPRRSVRRSSSLQERPPEVNDTDSRTAGFALDTRDASELFNVCGTRMSPLWPANCLAPTRLAVHQSKNTSILFAREL